jgi:hypothetical protein
MRGVKENMRGGGEGAEMWGKSFVELYYLSIGSREMLWMMVYGGIWKVKIVVNF